MVIVAAHKKRRQRPVLWGHPPTVGGDHYGMPRLCRYHLPGSAAPVEEDQPEGILCSAISCASSCIPADLPRFKGAVFRCVEAENRHPVVVSL